MPLTAKHLHLSGALPALALSVLLLSACSTPPVPPPAVAQSDEASGPESVRGRFTLAQANDVTLYAISLVGTPYRYGGNTVQGGFDCSGLIGHVYATRAGVVPPRTVAALADWGQPVAASQLRSGDLVVFASVGQAATHAGIYVGEGRFVHAPSTGGEVRLEPLSAKHWARQRISYRRP